MQHTELRSRCFICFQWPGLSAFPDPGFLPLDLTIQVLVYVYVSPLLPVTSSGSRCCQICHLPIPVSYLPQFRPSLFSDVSLPSGPHLTSSGMELSEPEPGPPRLMPPLPPGRTGDSAESDALVGRPFVVTPLSVTMDASDRGDWTSAIRIVCGDQYDFSPPGSVDRVPNPSPPPPAVSMG